MIIYLVENVNDVPIKSISFSNKTFEGLSLWELSHWYFQTIVIRLPKYDILTKEEGTREHYESVIWNPIFILKSTNERIDMNGINHFSDHTELFCVINTVNDLSEEDKLKIMFTSDEKCTSLVQMIEERKKEGPLAIAEEDWLDFHTAIFPCNKTTAEEVFETLENGVNPLETKSSVKKSKKRKSGGDLIVPTQLIGEGSYGVVMKAINTLTTNEVIVKYQKYDQKRLCEKLSCSDLNDCKMKKKICLLQDAIHEIFINSMVITPFVLEYDYPMFNVMVGSWLCNAPEDPNESGSFCLNSQNKSNISNIRYYSAFSPLPDVSIKSLVIDSSLPDDHTKLEQISDLMLQVFGALSMVQQPDQKYNHLDLHLSNILLEEYPSSFEITYGDDERIVVKSDYHPSIIDQGVAIIYHPSTNTLAWSPNLVYFFQDFIDRGYTPKTYMPGYDIILFIGSIICALWEDAEKTYNRLLYALCLWMNELYGCSEEKYISSSFYYSIVKGKQCRIPDIMFNIPPSFMNHLIDGVDYHDVIRSIITDLPRHFENTPSEIVFDWDDFKSNHRYTRPVYPKVYDVSTKSSWWFW
jgi:serine/threonine protein kinase